jgi:hypothetical protein
MSRINERVLTSFREELRKVAAIPWQELGRSTGAGMGAGAGILGALGAAHGAYRGWRDARAEGAGEEGAALRALGGGAKEGLTGAAIGGLGGALAGGAGAIARPELAARVADALERGPGAIGAFTRFGQRQVHSLTGWKPEGGLEAIRGGAWDQRENAVGALGALRGARAGGDEIAIGRAAERAQKAERARGAAQRVEDLGMTSLPGALGAMKKDPIGALRTGAAHQWHGMGRAEKALFLGVPAAQLGMAAAGNDEHKGEHVGEGIGNLAGMAAFGGAPLFGQLAGGVGAGMAGKAIGRGFDRMRSREGIVHRKPELEPVDNSMNIPVERSMSPAAMGQPPEGVGR